MIEDRRLIKELEDRIVNGEISPDDVTAAEAEVEEEIVDSTTPEKVKVRGKQKVGIYEQVMLAILRKCLLLY